MTNIQDLDFEIEFENCYVIRTRPVLKRLQYSGTNGKKSQIPKKVITSSKIVKSFLLKKYCCTNVSFRSQIYSVVVKTT